MSAEIEHVENKGRFAALLELINQEHQHVVAKLSAEIAALRSSEGSAAGQQTEEERVARPEDSQDTQDAAGLCIAPGQQVFSWRLVPERKLETPQATPPELPTKPAQLQPLSILPTVTVVPNGGSGDSLSELPQLVDRRDTTDTVGKHHRGTELLIPSPSHGNGSLKDRWHSPTPHVHSSPSLGPRDAQRVRSSSKGASSQSARPDDSSSMPTAKSREQSVVSVGDWRSAASTGDWRSDPSVGDWSAVASIGSSLPYSLHSLNSSVTASACSYMMRHDLLKSTMSREASRRHSGQSCTSKVSASPGRGTSTKSTKSIVSIGGCQEYQYEVSGSAQSKPGGFLEEDIPGFVDITSSQSTRPCTRDPDEGIASEPLDKMRQGAECQRMQSKRHNFNEVNQSLPVMKRVFAARSSFVHEFQWELLKEPDISWPSKFRIFLRSTAFDYFAGFILLLYAGFMGMHVNHKAQHRGQESPRGYQVAEMAFFFFFTLELLLRLWAFRLTFFTGNGWKWNVFDVLVVMMQFMEVLMAEVFGTDSLGKMGGMVTVMRVGRLVRLARMVRLVHELKTMVYLIAASMQSFFWTTMLLFLLMYSNSVYFTELVATSDYEGEGRELLYDNWGSLMRSILSLYKAISGGVSWGEVVTPIMDYVSVSASIIMFSFYILFATLVMLNLVTGVFVEGAQRIVKEEKDSDLIKVLHKAFVHIDHESDQISWNEFQTQLVNQRLDKYFAAFDFSEDEGAALFTLLDLDNSGSLTVDEFVSGSMRLRSPSRAVDVAMAHMKTRCMLAELIACVGRVESKMHENLVVRRPPPPPPPSSPRSGQVAPMRAHRRSKSSTLY